MITELHYVFSSCRCEYSFSVQYLATVGAPPLILLLTNDACLDNIFNESGFTISSKSHDYTAGS